MVITMIFQDMDRIVFAGDSVTDMGRNDTGEGLFDNVGRSYVREVENLLAATYPEVRVRITNKGRSGNTSRDLLARFERDVVDLAPDWVSICIGINDVWRQFDSPAIPDEQVMPEEYRENLTKMILSVTDKVKGIFLLTPYYIEPSREDVMRKRMDEYCDICRELADAFGCIFVDFQAMYEKYCTIRHSSYIAWDRVHPNQVGAMLMAKEFLKKCEFRFDR